MSNKNPAEIIKRMCLDKRPLSYEQANRTIDYHANSGMVMYFYVCPMCKRYHLSKYPDAFNKIEIIGGKNK